MSDAKRDSGKGGGPVAAVLARLSFANVTATLALFVALGGTATAAVTLARDSVGSVQIQADAVRSPEIRADAVRSSEIRDESILLADIAPGARTALDAPRVRIAEDDFDEVPACAGGLTACSNRLSVLLPSGSWLVQAKFTVSRNEGTDFTSSVCGLVQSDTTVIDDVRVALGDPSAATGGSNGEVVVLTDVLTGVSDDTRVALRCEEGVSEELDLADIKMTALEVGTVTGP